MIQIANEPSLMKTLALHSTEKAWCVDDEMGISLDFHKLTNHTGQGWCLSSFLPRKWVIETCSVGWLEALILSNLLLTPGAF